jgi:hypothetical protein
MSAGDTAPRRWKRPEAANQGEQTPSTIPAPRPAGNLGAPPPCSRCRDERLRAYALGEIAGYRKGRLAEQRARLRLVGDREVRR